MTERAEIHKRRSLTNVGGAVRTSGASVCQITSGNDRAMSAAPTSST